MLCMSVFVLLYPLQKSRPKKKSRVLFFFPCHPPFPAPGPRALRAYDDVTTNLRFDVSCSSIAYAICLLAFFFGPNSFPFGPLPRRLTPLDGREMAMPLSPVGICSTPLRAWLGHDTTPFFPPRLFCFFFFSRSGMILSFC